jgi:hypothetical protein
VIASDDAEIYEQVDNAALISVVDDPLSLFEAMQKIKSNQNLRKTLAERGHDRFDECAGRALINGWLEDCIPN